MKVVKASLWVVVATMLFAGVGVADTLDVATARRVRAIDRARRSIDRHLAGYTRRTRELPESAAEGGVMWRYDSYNSPRKIVVRLYSCSWQSRETYYFSGQRLIYAKHERMIYGDKPLGKIVRTDRSFYYFGSGKLIHWPGPMYADAVQLAVQKQAAAWLRAAAASKKKPA